MGQKSGVFINIKESEKEILKSSIYAMNTDRSFAEKNQETVELLMDTTFPDCQEVADDVDLLTTIFSTCTDVLIGENSQRGLDSVGHSEILAV